MMLLLLLVIYDQQHRQQQHLDIYDVVVVGNLRPTTPITTTFRVKVPLPTFIHPNSPTSHIMCHPPPPHRSELALS